MTEQQRAALLQQAANARSHAYAPYSRYPVGAALLTTSDAIYSGCNIENISYGLSLCAERVAVVKAVSEGATTFKAIAIATADGGMPCGACRQFLAEFCRGDFPVWILNINDDVAPVSLTLAELFPKPFALR